MANEDFKNLSESVEDFFIEAQQYAPEIKKIYDDSSDDDGAPLPTEPPADFDESEDNIPF